MRPHVPIEVYSFFDRMVSLGSIAIIAAALALSGPLAPNAAAQGDDAAPEAAPPAAAPPTAGPPAAAPEVSYLAWAYQSLGIGYSLVFLSLSFTLVALFVMNLLQASRSNVVPQDLIDGFQQHLEAKQYTEAYELASADDSFLGKVLSAGLGQISEGGDYPHAIEAMQEVGEEENMKLEHRLSYMALIGSISPMIGLLGTVQGMIASFQVIANAATPPKASELAAGISTALFTTLVGLMIAIPAIAAYNILRNRVARLVLEVGIVSEGLMSRFQTVGNKKGADAPQ
ncbi:Biopolymer transport protein ExbB [Pirellulimonas nuda]|uniref:Biopolymer transport protein ExbB n=1 Tax=Pirellulimonas nuda TaxID=2528009 RepID=A0A518D9Q2_9BACT|nr:MotA/TolQ/ExbB proton channel family protein [Pirellulimonas nuda]QDU88210.1 Biopolymer transport protein ExbB [Pirellulimonas nuda]